MSNIMLGGQVVGTVTGVKFDRVLTLDLDVEPFINTTTSVEIDGKLNVAFAIEGDALRDYVWRVGTAAMLIERPVVGWNPWLEKVTNG